VRRNDGYTLKLNLSDHRSLGFLRFLRILAFAYSLSLRGFIVFSTILLILKFITALVYVMAFVTVVVVKDTLVKGTFLFIFASATRLSSYNLSRFVLTISA
jgi:hypothetical protein